MHAALPPGVKQVYGRVDSGFHCREAVEAYEESNDWFVISARKTARLVEQLRQAEWKLSPKTDGDAECEFHYQPNRWKKASRFVALRYEETREQMDAANLIKEANNDAGLAAHPSGRFYVNGSHFRLAMLAYNLNCWLMLFDREPP